MISEVEGDAALMSLKPEGTRVRRGELVAELDSAPLRDRLGDRVISEKRAELSLGRARLAREAAESAAREYAEGTAPRELEELRGKVDHARAAIE